MMKQVIERMLTLLGFSMQKQHKSFEGWRESDRNNMTLLDFWTLSRSAEGNWVKLLDNAGNDKGD